MKTILRLIIFIFLFPALLQLQSCSNEADEPEFPTDKPSPESVRRTVLIYIVADNSLGTYGYDSSDIQEMLKGAADGNIPADARWIVYHAPARGENPRLIEFTQSDTITLKTYQHGGSVTYSRMNEVLEDVARIAPSEKMGLVLWSHATNWIVNGLDDNPDDLANKTAPLSFGIDGADNEKMNIATLRSVLRGKNIDYVYFDACFMGSIEVAYELGDVTDYIVASPAETPADGMPYDLNMGYLADGSPEALINSAETTFNTYNNLSPEYNRTSTMAVYATAGLKRLADATAAIYDITPLKHPGQLITNYRANVSSVRDAYDFGEYVEALAQAENLDPLLLNEYLEALDNVVIFKASTPKLWAKYPIYHYSGLSTFVFDDPADFTASGYDTLRWARDVVSRHLKSSTEN